MESMGVGLFWVSVGLRGVLSRVGAARFGVGGRGFGSLLGLSRGFGPVVHEWVRALDVVRWVSVSFLRKKSVIFLLFISKLVLSFFLDWMACLVRDLGGGSFSVGTLHFVTGRFVGESWPVLAGAAGGPASCGESNRFNGAVAFCFFWVCAVV